MNHVLESLLTSVGVIFDRLAADAHQQIESSWRDRFGQAFVIGARDHHGTKAVHEFVNQPERSWLFIPFLAAVEGTPVSIDGRSLSAFRCEGPLLELSEFSGIEFFVSPSDLSWTFVRTHEDFAFGGPYFVRAEWVEEIRDPKPSIMRRGRRRERWGSNSIREPVAEDRPPSSDRVGVPSRQKHDRPPTPSRDGVPRARSRLWSRLHWERVAFDTSNGVESDDAVNHSATYVSSITRFSFSPEVSRVQ